MQVETRMRAPKAPCASTGRTLSSTHQSLNLTSRLYEVGRLRPTLRAVPALAGARSSGFNPDAFDVVLSSGFLAFAEHSGFLQAIEQLEVPVAGVMGTSAGALVGSLYCAGYSPLQAAKYLSDQAPVSLLRPSAAPWRGGALSLDEVVARLRDLLPPRFEDLSREFAAGVVTADGEHLIIDSGPLPEAVAASAAIPFLFQGVDVPGDVHHLGPFKDGGVVDRVGLRAWRDRRRSQILQQQQQQKRHGLQHHQHPHQGAGRTSGAHKGAGAEAGLLRPPPCLVHVIDRSSPFSGFDDTGATGETHIVVVNSPRAKANLFHLGTFEETLRRSCDRARGRLLAQLQTDSPNSLLHKSSTPAPPSSPAAPAKLNGAEVSNGASRGASGSRSPKEAVARVTIF